MSRGTERKRKRGGKWKLVDNVRHGDTFTVTTEQGGRGGKFNIKVPRFAKVEKKK